jgi:hypothetical protein
MLASVISRGTVHFSRSSDGASAPSLRVGERIYRLFARRGEPFYRPAVSLA